MRVYFLSDKVDSNCQLQGRIQKIEKEGAEKIVPKCSHGIIKKKKLFITQREIFTKIQCVLQSCKVFNALAYKIINDRFLVTKIEHIKWFSKHLMFSRVNSKKRTPWQLLFLCANRSIKMNIWYQYIMTLSIVRLVSERKIGSAYCGILKAIKSILVLSSSLSLSF